MLIGRMLTTRNAAGSRTAIRLLRGNCCSAGASAACIAQALHGSRPTNELRLIRFAELQAVRGFATVRQAKRKFPHPSASSMYLRLGGIGMGTSYAVWCGRNSWRFGTAAEQ